MRHEYDDEQIFESNKIAARTTGRDWISRFNLRDVRAILDALPEPEPVADEWEECGPDELRKGDRYLVKGDGWSYEGVVSYSYFNILCTHPATGARLTKAMVKHRRSGLHLFRIPAPVQHPDPADNQFIIANGKKYVIFGDRYYNIEQVGIYGITGYFPEEFTSWEPADIVAKVIADE